MKSKLLCLMCGSENLRCYQDFMTTEYRNINKDRTISKRINNNKGIDDRGYAHGVQCMDCGACFDCELDYKDRIIELIEK